MLVVVVVSISATVGATVLTTVVGVTVVVVEEVVVAARSKPVEVSPARVLDDLLLKPHLIDMMLLN